MPNPVRVGVIGLGRRWRQRYRPALAALRDRFRVTSLYDPIRARALAEAQRLGCQAAAGIAPLLDGDGVDAVLLLGAPWFGLWPLERACAAGKPVFCAAPLEADDAHADALLRCVRDDALPVMVELPPRVAPVTARLRELLDGPLGPARAVVCHAPLPACAGHGPGALLGGRGTTLLDWCAGFLQGQPVSVSVSGTGDGALASLFLEYDGGRALQVVGRRMAGVRPGLRLEVLATHGMATVRPPRHVAWTGPDGRHAHLLPRPRPLGQVLLERFHATVTEKRSPNPALLEVAGCLPWLRAALQSQAEGRRVPLSAEPSSADGV
jgi:predicted dehydrogenase